jgi:hypothetical protein
VVNKKPGSRPNDPGSFRLTDHLKVETNVEVPPALRRAYGRG